MHVILDQSQRRISYVHLCKNTKEICCFTYIYVFKNTEICFFTCFFPAFSMYRKRFVKLLPLSCKNTRKDYLTGYYPVICKNREVTVKFYSNFLCKKTHIFNSEYI